MNSQVTANAGVDQTITLPVNSATLTGSGTDIGGTIASYQWVAITGPSTVTITNATSASTTITALVQGTYKFALTVTDNFGTTAKDTIQITVNPANCKRNKYRSGSTCGSRSNNNPSGKQHYPGW